MPAKRPADEALLQSLRDHGDDLATPRHTIAYFYRIEDDSRDPAAVFVPMAERLSDLGWRVVERREDALIVETHRPADPASVDAMSDALEALATEFQVEFDGWECALSGDS